MSFSGIAEKAARLAGELLLNRMGRVDFREKSRADLVSDADFEAQALIQSVVLESYPDHLFLGEETDGFMGRDAGRQSPDHAICRAIPENNYCWIVDPLDGTTNYIHQLPFFCTSVALYHGNVPVCGVIFNPCSRECFTAEKGEGAFLNGQRLHTSRVVDVKNALASVGFPTDCRHDSPDLLAFLKAVPLCQAIRRTGSASLNMAFLSAGRFDAMWCIAIHPWDVAAGALLIQEAGGVITGTDGLPFSMSKPSFLAAANTVLHQQFLEMHANPGQMNIVEPPD